MITSKLSQFSAQQLPTETLQSIKGGGVFCDIYLGHLAANDLEPNEAQMEWAMSLDSIVATAGYKEAYYSGGSSFITLFS